MVSWASVRTGVLLAVVAAAAACAPDPEPDPGFPGAGTADISRAPAGDIAHLTEVRLEAQDGFDRVVLEFADRVPGYTVGYRTLPAHADASGAEVPLPGAGALLQVVLNPATAHGWGGGERTYFGPSELRADTASITEVKAAGDFEATLTWVVGTRTQVPFAVQVLDEPPRLVVDVQS